MQSRGDLIDRMQQNNLRGLASGVYCFTDLSEVWSFMPTEMIVEYGKQSDTYYLIVEGVGIVALKAVNKWQHCIRLTVLEKRDCFSIPPKCIRNCKNGVILCVSQSQFMQCFSRFPVRNIIDIVGTAIVDMLTQVFDSGL